MAANERDIEAYLVEALEAFQIEIETTPELPEVRIIQTFEDIGLLSGNRGIVIRLEDGSEFQLSIVQSR